jgi:asparagine synthase (glutamine-hydrolysing)
VIEPDGRSRDRVYWRPDYERDPDKLDWTAADWRDAVHEHLRTAVQRRLVADVPVGVLLSGGVDSSIIVALMAELGVTGVPTFSIGFDDANGECGNEFEYSDLIARQFGTDHHQLHVGSASLPSSVMLAVNAMTEPMTTPDVTAFFLLCQAVSEHVTVVQSGQGADEVFAGYSYHQPAAAAGRDEAQRVFSREFSEYDHAQLGQVISTEHRAGTAVAERLLKEDLSAAGADTALDAVLRLDTHTLMVDDPVKRLDSMAMAWALEARVPFLDQDLVRIAAECPPELKAVQGGKGILKDLARTLIPASVIDRPKGYFPVPGVRHLDESMISLLTSVLTSSECRSRGIFRADHLERLLADPNGAYGPVGGNTLWQIGLLELWLQLHHIPA